MYLVVDRVKDISVLGCWVLWFKIAAVFFFLFFCVDYNTGRGNLHDIYRKKIFKQKVASSNESGVEIQKKIEDRSMWKISWLTDKEGKIVRSGCIVVLTLTGNQEITLFGQLLFMGRASLFHIRLIRLNLFTTLRQKDSNLYCGHEPARWDWQSSSDITAHTHGRSTSSNSAGVM